MHSHNVVHHTWTNVLGKDLDVGYGIMRVTPMQKWHPAYLLQPIIFVMLMLFFEEGVALHEQAIDDHMKGKKTFSEIQPLLKRIGCKVWRQVVKDYIAWPARRRAGRDPDLVLCAVRHRGWCSAWSRAPTPSPTSCATSGRS